MVDVYCTLRPECLDISQTNFEVLIRRENYAFTKWRKAATIFVTSAYTPVRPSVGVEQLGSHWTDCHEIWYFEYFSKIYIESTFVTVSRSILLRLRNVSGKSCRENQNTHFVFSNFPKILPFLFWDNVEWHGSVLQATDDDIIRRVRIVCRVTKTTNTHLECVILTAFARQQWLRECAWLLRLNVQCFSRYM